MLSGIPMMVSMVAVFVVKAISIAAVFIGVIGPVVLVLFMILQQNQGGEPFLADPAPI